MTSALPPLHQEDRLTCRYCCKTFQRPARLRQHMATHTPEGPANHCHLCSKTFSQKYYLREHIKQVSDRTAWEWLQLVCE